MVRTAQVTVLLNATSAGDQEKPGKGLTDNSKLNVSVSVEKVSRHV